jgi:acetylornithine deacetylase/succinyl-diaminopimelate desuccinylase-like protein
MEAVIKYIKDNKDNYLNELIEYLKIPSISTLEENKGDMQKCASFVADKLKDAGMNRVEIFQTKGHPLVYGEWLEAPGQPTVLFYGHYDVQPVDPIELWDSPPFEPVVKDGKIWGRGTSDDKGQNFVHIKSVEAFFKTTGKIPVNVKFILEGEEEIGSEHFSEFLKEKKELLKCDTVVISDTSLYADGIPTIGYGLRGLCYMEVELTTVNRDLHSGTFGGAVANPINELAKIIAKLHDKNGKITIPKFYDDVLPLTKKEKENIKSLKFSDKKYAKEIEAKELQGEKGFSTLERIWARPTLDANGIFGGYTAKGAKTVLPAKATAKISMRLVPNQTPEKAAKMFTSYIKSLAPKSVKVEITSLHGSYPIVVSLDSPAMLAASKAMSKAYNKKTVYTREGGSIGVVVDFVKQLKVPTILMGIGLDSENIHSPNEHFSLKSFELGILSSAYFMEEFKK